MKSINDLPDLCLENIFSKLPLRDLLQIYQVCSTWARIQRRIRSKHRHLNIFICHRDVRMYMPCHRQSNYSLLFEIPYYSQLSNNCTKVSELFHPFKSPQNLLHFQRFDEPSVNQIVQLLPNITTLCIATNDVVPVTCIGEKSWGVKRSLFEQLIVLLKGWSANLRVLKMYISWKDTSPEHEQIVAVDFRKMINTINTQLPSLKHLTLAAYSYFHHDLTEEMNETNEKIAFLVLEKLDELYLSIPNIMYDSMVDSLIEHAGINSRISLTIEPLNENVLARFDDNLASKFVRLPDLSIYRADESMRAICSRFTRLQSLTISSNDTRELGNLFKLLKPLRELVYLDIHITVDQSIFDQCVEPEYQDAPRVQLASVKVMRFQSDYFSHNYLKQIQWGNVFPNLCILIYHCGIYECQICNPVDFLEYYRNTDHPILVFDSEDKEKQYFECLRRSFQPWKHCTKLHTIYTFPPGDYLWDENGELIESDIGNLKKWSAQEAFG